MTTNSEILEKMKNMDSKLLILLIRKTTLMQELKKVEKQILKRRKELGEEN